jgi:hypothetical protein
MNALIYVLVPVTLELWYPEARTTPLVVVDLAVD